jgi:hypothetical protein
MLHKSLSGVEGRGGMEGAWASYTLYSSLGTVFIESTVTEDER